MALYMVPLWGVTTNFAAQPGNVDKSNIFKVECIALLM
jgi:hypothetical protein